MTPSRRTSTSATTTTTTHTTPVSEHDPKPHPDEFGRVPSPTLSHDDFASTSATSTSSLRRKGSIFRTTAGLVVKKTRLSALFRRDAVPVLEQDPPVPWVGSSAPASLPPASFEKDRVKISVRPKPKRGEERTGSNRSEERESERARERARERERRRQGFGFASMPAIQDVSTDVAGHPVPTASGSRLAGPPPSSFSDPFQQQQQRPHSNPHPHPQAQPHPHQRSESNPNITVTSHLPSQPQSTSQHPPRTSTSSPTSRTSLSTPTPPSFLSPFWYRPEEFDKLSSRSGPGSVKSGSHLSVGSGGGQGYIRPLTVPPGTVRDGGGGGGGHNHTMSEPIMSFRYDYERMPAVRGNVGAGNAGTVGKTWRMRMSGLWRQSVGIVYVFFIIIFIILWVLMRFFFGRMGRHSHS
ncbi:hypothetical protein M422DRAFT_55126 [Sphaerobolus stellatus SS14]|uniref:Uncharacterized protein n=1 Tax=Sphaerobolus stellatus (strain SS14) TaxID=990650 RepID=A0A0C9TDL4_SPHS4|nr:hypothetical protein M422DRAFT_55126 [Sphaerobolus stellatus SS14]